MTVKKIILRSVWLVTACLLLAACQDAPGGKNEKIIVFSEGASKKTVMDTFIEFPPEIDGCAGYYAASEQEFKEKKYLYTEDMGTVAFVKINGVRTKFTLSKPDTSEKTQTVEIWKNKDYELTIILKTTQKIDEVQKQEGGNIMDSLLPVCLPAPSTLARKEGPQAVRYHLKERRKICCKPPIPSPADTCTSIRQRPLRPEL